MIEIHSLTFGYPGHTLLFEGFTWQVSAGETWSIIGPSGSGKSTLLYLIAGLQWPRAGTVTVAGEAVPRKKQRGKTGLVLQEYGLLPWATIQENALLGLRIRHFYGQDAGAAIDADHAAFWLERVGLAEHRDKYPNQVSGGQRQRAALARTLTLDPDVLLLDEPFSALDALTREDMQRLMRELHAETGVTTVLVTHNIEEAVYLGRHILVLGAAPNRAAHVIDNPGMGQMGFRNSAAFHAKTVELRGVLTDSEVSRAHA